jgi:hypothetical protein
MPIAATPPSRWRRPRVCWPKARRRGGALSSGSAVAQNGQGLLIIACGALAHEIIALKRANAWDQIDVRCLPAELHNRPERIPAAVRALIRSSRGHYRSIFVAYADCGTGGLLDAVLAEEGVERIPGAHCYEFFATSPVFAALAEAEIGTFYLTDFLLRHFERLVIRGSVSTSIRSCSRPTSATTQARVPGAGAERGCGQRTRVP